MAADQAQALTPLMIWAATVELRDDQVLGEFLVPIIAVERPDEKLDSAATFTATIPRAGNYRLWARLRFPSGAAEAFNLVAGKDGSQPVLGLWLNPPANNPNWWWLAARAEQTITNVATGIVELPLTAGKWTFRLRVHRVGVTVYGPQKWKHAEPAFNPRVNLFCLTDEPDYTPTDDAARQALSPKPVAPATARAPAFARQARADLIP